MKPKPETIERQQYAILRALLRQYHRAVNNWKVPRRLLYCKQFFPDSFVRCVVWELCAQDGDWQQTKTALQSMRGIPSDRLQKLSVWASRVKGGVL